MMPAETGRRWLPLYTLIYLFMHLFVYLFVLKHFPHSVSSGKAPVPSSSGAAGGIGARV